MSNSQQTADQAIGIVQTSYTVSVTFSSKPDDELRRKLKAAGFLYDRGRCYRNESKSNNASQATIDQLLAA